jgi:hypothetical protein
MRIQFYTPLNVDPPRFEVMEMPIVPRAGEHIMFEYDGDEYVVLKVCWTPHESDYDAYVSLR